MTNVFATVLRARSARGLSLPAYILETLAYAITAAYSIRNQFPFSTYGENAFLTIQNVIITLLIIYYPSPTLRHSQNTSARLSTAAVGTFAAGAALYVVPKETLALLQLSTLPLTLFSKIPQIRQNARAKSTGQLSTFAVASQVLGCLARLFTTATEVGDFILTIGFALALALNLILGVQMWMYWGRDVDTLPTPTPVPLRSEKGWIGTEKQDRVDIVVPPQSPAPVPTNRKWSRKLD